MYKNKARLEYKALNDGDDAGFDMGSVLIPEIERKAHATSTAYRSQVGSPVVGFNILPHSGFKLGYDKWCFKSDTPKTQKAGSHVNTVSCVYYMRLNPCFVLSDSGALTFAQVPGARSSGRLVTLPESGSSQSTYRKDAVSGGVSDCPICGFPCSSQRIHQGLILSAKLHLNRPKVCLVSFSPCSPFIIVAFLDAPPKHAAASSPGVFPYFCSCVFSLMCISLLSSSSLEGRRAPKRRAVRVSGPSFHSNNVNDGYGEEEEEDAM